MRDEKLRKIVESEDLARRISEVEEYAGVKFELGSSIFENQLAVRLVDEGGGIILIKSKEDHTNGFRIAMTRSTDQETLQEGLSTLLEDTYYTFGETEKSVRMKLQIRGQA